MSKKDIMHVTYDRGVCLQVLPFSAPCICIGSRHTSADVHSLQCTMSLIQHERQTQAKTSLHNLPCDTLSIRFRAMFS